MTLIELFDELPVEAVRGLTQVHLEGFVVDCRLFEVRWFALSAAQVIAHRISLLRFLLFGGLLELRFQQRELEADKLAVQCAVEVAAVSKLLEDDWQVGTDSALFFRAKLQPVNLGRFFCIGAQQHAIHFESLPVELVAAHHQPKIAHFLDVNLFIGLSLSASLPLLSARSF